ncbi:MAG: 2-succinyl-5-enolpyruvyl-6-hydroxy-3-cyclohexene-1-carboxylic-acid synthase [Thermomicrobiales bacterium]
MEYGRANLSFSATLLDSAVQSGLHHVVICPGSRSTPLALAAALHPVLKTYVLIDERSAAFFALGMARQLGEPVALICTSGTAAANFAPAVIEACLSRIPLIVLTADRPAELRGWGASQTIDQVDLYGHHTRWSHDLPAPVGDSSESRFARATASRAMQQAVGSPAGPVHLNVQFREPLIPPDADPLAFLRACYAVREEVNVAPTQARQPAPADIERLTSLVVTHPRGLIVCGPHSGPDLGTTVAAFSTVAGYPCLADPLSTVRYSWPGPTGLIDAYDVFLRDNCLSEQLSPDFVIRVGALPTSKPLMQFLGRQEVPVVAIDPGDLRDAGHAVTWHLAADEQATLGACVSALTTANLPVKADWPGCWQELNARTRRTLDASIDDCPTLSEPSVAANLMNAMPTGGTVVIGNSMPVRDVDTFAAGGHRGIRVVGTRGASGIDGVASTALGAAAVTTGPVALLVGDLSFLHDLGGLHAAQYAEAPLVIVVVNNDGGGIFSFLPQYTQLDVGTFERLFGAPAAVDIAGAARLFGCTYARPTTLKAFKDIVSHGLSIPGVTVVEVRTDRAQNLTLHRKIAAAVLAELTGWRPA